MITTSFSSDPLSDDNEQYLILCLDSSHPERISQLIREQERLKAKLKELEDEYNRKVTLVI